MAAAVQHACELMNECGMPGLWLHVDALLIIFPFFYMRFAHALPQAAITALALDAMWAGPFGTRLVVYSLVLAVFLPLRVRVRRENPSHMFFFGMMMTLVTFAGLTAASMWAIADWSAFSPLRSGYDLAASMLVCGSASYWWMEFQRRSIIGICGEDPAGYSIS
jgi:hypothetical protein